MINDFGVVEKRKEMIHMHAEAMKPRETGRACLVRSHLAKMRFLDSHSDFVHIKEN